MAEPTQVYQNQVGFSPDIADYAHTLLGAAQDYVFGTPAYTDADGNHYDATEGTPYVSYSDWARANNLSGDQVAQFSGLQNQAFNNAAHLNEATGGYDPRSVQAATGLQGLAQQAGNTSYQGSTFTNQFNPNGNYNYQAQSSQAANAGSAPSMQAASAGRAPQGRAAQSNNVAQVQAAQAGAAPRVGAAQVGSMPQVQAAQLGNAPRAQAERLGAAPRMQAAQGNFDQNSLQHYQMNAPQQVRSQNFGQSQADQYMSPYMQSVVANQQRDAQRQADIATTQRNAAATGAGAFGGSRQAIMDAEAARNLAQQKGDIQAQGLQNAFANAQQQFNADQGRNLTAQQSNQGAGLTTGTQNLNANLSTQQLGANLGQQMNMANLQNRQQANQQNQATQSQFALANAGYGNQANLANQQMQGQYGMANAGYQQAANMANQQAGIQGLLTNAGYQQAANLANQQMQGQYGMANLNNQQAANMANQNAQNQFGMANLNNQQQMNLANQQMQGQYGLANAGFQQAANQSNQQMQGQYGLANAGFQQATNLANQNAANQAGQFNAGQNLNANNLNAQYGQAANQLNAQQQQFGANLGLQGLQAGMAGYGSLGSLGQNMYGQATGNINLMNQLGTQQQQQAQNMINANMQNYANQQSYPYRQMGFMSDMIRGLPLSNQGSAMYQAPPSTFSQVAGLGLTAAGLYGTGRKRGGAIKSKQPSGLPALMISKIA